MSDSAQVLAGIRVALVSLIPDAGHVIPLIRIGKVLEASGAEVRLICPDEAVHLAANVALAGDGFGKVVPQSELHYLSRLSKQSMLAQRVIGNPDLWRQYTWALFENVFKQLPLVESLVRRAEPHLLITDDHLFRTQYRWLAEQAGVPLILHYSAGTRYPSARAEAWTWLSGRTEKALNFASRVRDALVVRWRRVANPAGHADFVRRLTYLKEQWSYFSEEAARFKRPVVRVATGTAVLEERYCAGVIRPESAAETIALPPLPPLDGTALDPDLAEWLEADKDRPVLYACFGTMVNPSPELCDRLIKLAFEQGARVLWASAERPRALAGTDEGRSKWIRWAPQARVLAHPRVTAFLSHAGAGALQEALWYGKPIICVPFQWDQFYNAWLATQLGCGVALGRWDRSTKIRAAMKAALTEPVLRERAVALSQILGQAGPGGGGVVQIVERVMAQPESLVAS